MRGSREISLAPSLHRASTDALIKNSTFVTLKRRNKLRRMRQYYSAFTLTMHVGFLEYYLTCSACCHIVDLQNPVPLVFKSDA